MSAERILLAATLLAGIVMTSSAWAWTERDVATGAEPARLHGTLTLPVGTALASGVLILAGSGPVDRNGNLPGLPNDSLKLLAHALADRGIVSLRVDNAASVPARRLDRGRWTCASTHTLMTPWPG